MKQSTTRASPYLPPKMINITMKVAEYDKDKIKRLAELILNNPEGVDGINIDLGKNAKSFIPYLLKTSRWARAVDPLVIADPNSEEDKTARAKGILSSVIVEPLKNKKFLDFGCGEGHVVRESPANFSMGFDININKKPDIALTDDWQEVKKHSFDVILAFDTLDHVQDEDTAIDCLKRMKDVLNSDGKVCLRLHPWCSRHGTHIYRKLNKAYAHLCLDEEELEKYEGIHTLKLIHPLNSYLRWIKEAGLISIRHNVLREQIEPFFMESPVADAIKKHWKSSHDPLLAGGNAFPSYQLEQQFVDHVLTKG